MSDGKQPFPREPADREPDTGPVLRFERAHHPSGAAVLRAIGAIDDDTAPDLWVELGVSSEEHSDLILDLSGIDFLGTAGLTSLLQTRDAVDAGGGRLRVAVGGSRPARRALQVSGAMELIEVVDRIPAEPTASAELLFVVPSPGRD